MPSRPVTVLKRYPSTWALPLAALAVLLGVSIWGVLYVASKDEHASRDAVRATGQQAAAVFQSMVSNMIFGCNIEKSIVETNALQWAKMAAIFPLIAADVRNQLPAIRWVALLPAGVVQLLEPPADADSVLGQDLFNGSTRSIAMAAVETGRVFMLGPQLARDGGMTFDIGVPVYIHDVDQDNSFGWPDMVSDCGKACYNTTTRTQFWGFVVMRAAVYDSGGGGSWSTHLEQKGFRYSLSMVRKADGGGSSTSDDEAGPQGPSLRFVSGRPPRHPVKIPVKLPQGEWELSLEPEEGWEATWVVPVLVAVILASVGIAALLFGVLYFRRRLDLLLESLLPKEMLDTWERNRSATGMQRATLTPDSPADLMLGLTGKLLQGQMPDLSEVLIVRGAIRENYDLYQPLNLATQMQGANMDADVARALMRQLGNSGPVGQQRASTDWALSTATEGQIRHTRRSLGDMWPAEDESDDLTLQGGLALIMCPSQLPATPARAPAPDAPGASGTMPSANWPLSPGFQQLLGGSAHLPSPRQLADLDSGTAAPSLALAGAGGAPSSARAAPRFGAGGFNISPASAVARLSSMQQLLRTAPAMMLEDTAQGMCSPGSRLMAGRSVDAGIDNEDVFVEGQAGPTLMLRPRTATHQAALAKPGAASDAAAAAAAGQLPSAALMPEANVSVVSDHAPDSNDTNGPSGVMARLKLALSGQGRRSNIVQSLVEAGAGSRTTPGMAAGSAANAASAIVSGGGGRRFAGATAVSMPRRPLVVEGSSHGAMTEEVVRAGCSSRHGSGSAAHPFNEQEEAVVVVPPGALLQEAERALLGCDEWGFDVFKLQEATQGHALSALSFFLMHRAGLIATLELDGAALARYLVHIEGGYLANPYHNAVHAASVLQVLHVLLHQGRLAEHYVDPLGLLAAYMAAAVHDYGHYGLTNDFLVATGDGLALRYNDRSPMENHHCAAAFEALQRPDLNFAKRLARQRQAALRKQVIEMVLATDMKQHFSILSHFNAAHRLAPYTPKKAKPASGGAAPAAVPPPRTSTTGNMTATAANNDANTSTANAANNSAGQAMAADVSGALLSGGFLSGSAHASGPAPVPQDDTDKLLGLQMALKCADLGHLAAERQLHERWLGLLEEEFFLQGDRERAAGMPISPLFDRRKQGASKSQVGFYDFVVLPLFHAFAGAFPGAKPLLRSALLNYGHWVKTEAEAAAAAKVVQE